MTVLRRVLTGARTGVWGYPSRGRLLVLSDGSAVLFGVLCNIALPADSVEFFSYMFDELPVHSFGCGWTMAVSRCKRSVAVGATGAALTVRSGGAGVLVHPDTAGGTVGVSGALRRVAEPLVPWVVSVDCDLLALNSLKVRTDLRNETIHVVLPICWFGAMSG